MWLFLLEISPGSGAAWGVDGCSPNDIDNLLPAAVEILHDHCHYTQSRLVVQPIALLQRRLKLSYSRALGLADKLQEQGVVSRNPTLVDPQTG